MTDKQRTDYTIPDAAKVFNCTPNTVAGWITAGKLKAYRLGGTGHFRIPWAELDRVKAEWMASPDTSEAL